MSLTCYSLRDLFLRYPFGIIVYPTNPNSNTNTNTFLYPGTEAPEPVKPADEPPTAEADGKDTSSQPEPTEPLELEATPTPGRVGTVIQISVFSISDYWLLIVLNKCDIHFLSWKAPLPPRPASVTILKFILKRLDKSRGEYKRDQSVHYTLETCCCVFVLFVFLFYAVSISVNASRS